MEDGTVDSNPDINTRLGLKNKEDRGEDDETLDRQGTDSSRLLPGAETVERLIDL